MLQKLREAFCNSCIESYWVKKVNLLENIGNGEMMNIERRLFHILRDIEKNILDDRYAIAKYVCEYLLFFFHKISKLHTHVFDESEFVVPFLFKKYYKDYR